MQFMRVREIAPTNQSPVIGLAYLMYATRAIIMSGEQIKNVKMIKRLGEVKKNSNVEHEMMIWMDKNEIGYYLVLTQFFARGAIEQFLFFEVLKIKTMQKISCGFSPFFS